MVRTFFLDQHITRLRTSAGMLGFLQRRFVVNHRELRVAALMHFGKAGFQDRLLDETMREDPTRHQGTARR